MTFKLEVVKQKYNYDCGAACISMISNLPLDYVLNKFEIQNGINEQRLIEMLENLGINYTLQPFDNTIKTGVYIVTVPSINFPKFLHYCVFDTLSKKDHIRILDPSPKKTYKPEDFNGGMSWAETIKVEPKDLSYLTKRGILK